MALSTYSDVSATADNRTLSVTIPSVAVGDVFVLGAQTEDRGFPQLAPGGYAGITWTASSADSTASHVWAGTWTGVATSASGSPVAVTSAPNYVANQMHGMAVAQCPTADGYSLAGTPAVVDTPSVTSGPPSATLTAAGSGSLLFGSNGDWNAIDGTTRTYRSSATEISYIRNASLATFYWWTQVTPGTGAQAMGLTAPAGQAFTVLGVEVLKSSSGTAASGTAALTLTGSGATSAPAASTGSLTFTATSAAGARATATASLTITGAGSAQATASASAALSFTGTGAAQAPTGSTAALTFTATGGGRGVAASTASMTLTASGTAVAAGGGTAALTLTGTGAATAPAIGSAALTLTGAANTSGSLPASGTGALSLTATGTGQASASGGGALSLTASGTARAPAASSGLISLTGAGTPGAATVGTGSISLTAATGTFTARATGQALLTLTGLLTTSPVVAPSVGTMRATAGTAATMLPTATAAASMRPTS